MTDQTEPKDVADEEAQIKMQMTVHVLGETVKRATANVSGTAFAMVGYARGKVYISSDQPPHQCADLMRAALEAVEEGDVTEIKTPKAVQ